MGGTVKSSEGTSITYWIEKLQRYEPVLMTFVTISEGLSGPSGDTAEKFIKIKFSMQPNSFAFGMNNPAQTISISGIITDITNILRTTNS